MSYPSSWDPRVSDIAHFVENKRNLTFVHPVAVEFLADRAFNGKVTTDQTPTTKQRADMNNFVATLRALGLVNGPLDLQQASNKLASNEIIGLYSPRSKRIYVRGDRLTPDVRETLAHELTHALQDQHFPLDRYRDSKAPSGVTTGYRTLFEADAVRVQNAYEAAMSEDDKKTLAKAHSQQVAQAKAADVPDVLENMLSFPYVLGPAFVYALERQGGNEAIDRAFRKPPASEAQIVDPQSYLSGGSVTKVPPPHLEPNQSKVDHPDDFGQVSLLMVLGQRLPYATVWPAVQAWTGDQYVTYRQAGRLCVAIDAAFRTPADADRFASASSGWARTLPAASSTRLTPTAVELRSCDPGTAGPPPAVPQPSAFDALAVRGALIAEGEKAGLSLPVATCASDRILAEAGAAQILALNDVTDPKDPRARKVQTIAQRAFVACARG
ncbi:MAG: hypothetical protein JWP02_3823 [Acidimicrobiales bacterium]|nr:hypothetical protein [Acidimicrobiales bacterium]